MRVRILLGMTSLTIGAVVHLCALLLLSLYFKTASADPVPIFNAGFEADPAPVPSDITVGIPSGWTAYNPSGIPGVFYGSLYAAPDNYPAGAPEADHVQVNFIPANRPAGQEFGVFQTLSEPLQGNTLYTLTVEVGNIASGINDLNGTPDNPNDDSFFDISGFNGYRVELRTDSIAGSGATLMVDTLSVGDPNAIPDGEFRTVSFTFDSRDADNNLYGEMLEILLVNLNQIDPAYPGSDRETNFDHLRLESSPVVNEITKVPMPFVTLLLLGFGIASVGFNANKTYKSEA